MKKSVYIAVIALLVVAFGISAFYLGNYFWEGKKSEDRYNELSQMVQNAATEAAQSAAGVSPTTPQKNLLAAEDILPDYQELHEMNPDVVGWLKIEGTPIDYPVMQSSMEEKNFYLYRDFDKKDSRRGSLYAREECDVLTPGDNVTIYGHNMKDGSMFASLLQYDEKEAWEKNSLIFFNTLNEYHVYKIFAVFKTTAALGEGFSFHKMENAANADDFNKFIAKCKELSFYDTGIIPTYGDKVICLCTCEYTLSDGRFIVAAVRIA